MGVDSEAVFYCSHSDIIGDIYGEVVPLRTPHQPEQIRLRLDSQYDPHKSKFVTPQSEAEVFELKADVTRKSRLEPKPQPRSTSMARSFSWEDE